MVLHKVHLDPSLKARIVRSAPLIDPRTGESVVAASASLLLHGRLFCVQDDALSAMWVDPLTMSFEKVILMHHGERLSKKKKADFEAVFATSNNVIFVLGSGGTDERTKIVRYDAGSLATDVIDASALYEALAKSLTRRPNIEGAVLIGDVVRLFHRANGKLAGNNAIFDVELSTIEAGEGPILAAAFYDLGSIAKTDGAPGSSNGIHVVHGNGLANGAVPLTFTDATVLTDGRVLFLAGAEDSEDAILDGPVLGSAVGVLEGEGGRYALLTEENGEISHRKVEGVALMQGETPQIGAALRAPPTGAQPTLRPHRTGAQPTLRALLVTDPDNVEVPSELCWAELEGFSQ